MPLTNSGSRQLEGLYPGSHAVEDALPRIWKMKSSGSVWSPSAAEEVWPAVQAEVLFWAIDANFDAEPNRSSR